MDRLTAYRKPLFALAVFAFLFGGTFNLAHAGMSMEDGQMSGCPFVPGMSAICTMNPLEHIAAWQSMFTIVPAEKTFAFLLLFLFALLAVRALRTKIRWTFDLLQSYTSPQRTSNVFVPRYALQEAFSDGIINPKVF